MEQILNINSRDNNCLKVKVYDLMKLDEFYIQNLILDIKDDSKEIYIEIDEDYDIIKCIYDSLRYRTIIFNDLTNLRLMLMVAEKWCVPNWLLNDIKKKIDSNKRLDSLNTFIDNLTGGMAYCKVCKAGFDINKNTATSCKTHRVSGTIVNSNTYSCCNKEEPCKVGYHVPCENYYQTIINTMKYSSFFDK